jgi:hypothetical protein
MKYPVYGCIITNSHGANERCRQRPGKTIGGNSWGNSLRKKTQNSTLVKPALQELTARRVSKKSGGRSRNRTYDLAHVRHTDPEPNLLELLTELFLEADAGGE